MKNIWPVIVLIAVVITILLLRSCEPSPAPEIATEEITAETQVLEEDGTESNDTVPGNNVTEEIPEDVKPKPIQIKSHEQLMLGVVHTVKDVDVWLASYYRASEKSKRVSLYQNMDYPNRIFIIEKIDKQRVKEKISKGYGSQNYFFNVEYLNANVNLQPYFIAVYYEMEDFDKWKSIFESATHQQIREEAGLQVWGYAKGYLNPNLIYLLYTSADIDGIRELISQYDFEAAYKEAGILSSPVINYLKHLEGPDTE